MIELRLMGGLDIAGPGVSPSARSLRRHPMALLALVATAAPHPLAREKIMAFFWPESDTGRASNSLRQTLFWLRRDLGDDLFLIDNASGVQLDPAKLVVDLWTFRDAREKSNFEDAVAVYHGPFLDGFQLPGAPGFSRWVETERDRIERQYSEALDSLASFAEDEGRTDDAVAWRRRQAAADPFSSRTAMALLKALAAARDRPGALNYATVYESLVRQHLEAEPDPAVVAFVASLREYTPAVVQTTDEPRSLRPKVLPGRDATIHTEGPPVAANGLAVSSPVPPAERTRTRRLSWRLVVASSVAITVRGYLLNSSDHYILWSWRFRLPLSRAVWTTRVTGSSSTSSSRTRRVAWPTWSGSAGQMALRVLNAG